MAKKKQEVKTNAMRILEKMKIPYEMQSYECGEFEDGGKVADLLGLDHAQVYKTLVCHGTGKPGNQERPSAGAGAAYYVFVIPIDEELDLKKAARSVGAKSMEMIHVKDIKDVTGYVRGGCTSIGMKKAYPVRIDQSACSLSFLYVSAGKIGCQLRLTPEDLKAAAAGEWADLTKDKELSING
jgi:Cys-tRNA(Pro)/Cys-tRNA(Cys) deacylase